MSPLAGTVLAALIATGVMSFASEGSAHRRDHAMKAGTYTDAPIHHMRPRKPKNVSRFHVYRDYTQFHAPYRYGRCGRWVRVWDSYGTHVERIGGCRARRKSVSK